MARRALTPEQLAVVQAVRPHLADASRPLVVGLSGGADSWALAAAVAQCLSGEGDPGALAVVVDHQLQPGSGEVAAQVAGHARSLGLRAEVRRVVVEPGGEGVEAAARTARLDALTRDGGRVLLGHTLDDQAEQVLLGLARGSGAASLQGIAPSRAWGSATLLRPLLGIAREQTRAAAHAWQLPVWDDPMNADPAFLRVRVRHELLPVLTQTLGPGTREALARSAEMLRDDNTLLDELAADLLQRCRGVEPAAGESLACGALAAAPRALATRAVRQWLLERGAVGPTRSQVLQVLQLVDAWHGQAGVDLAGGVRACRRDGRLWVG